MTLNSSSPVAFVMLRESTVSMLMALRSCDRETLDDDVAHCIEASHKTSEITATPETILPSPSPPAAVPAVAPVSTWPEATTGVYVAAVIGVPVGASTLGEMLHNIVDTIHDVDPAAIERLSEIKANTRHYVSRTREGVHGGRRKCCRSARDGGSALTWGEGTS